MKSTNNLTLTGILATDVVISPERRSGRCTLVHNFGGGKPPLFLNCFIPEKNLDLELPGKGSAVRIEAYIRPGRNGVLAIIKKISKTL